MVVQLQEHEVWQVPVQEERKTHEYTCLFLLPLGVSQAGPLQVAANMGGNPGAFAVRQVVWYKRFYPHHRGNPPRPLVKGASQVQFCYPIVPSTWNHFCSFAGQLLQLSAARDNRRALLPGCPPYAKPASAGLPMQAFCWAYLKHPHVDFWFQYFCSNWKPFK